MEPLVHGYDELRLRIHPRQRSAYDVFASTRSAEASARFELPYGERELDVFIGNVNRSQERCAGLQASALDEARRVACDAMIVPIVTATLDTTHLGDLILACLAYQCATRRCLFRMEVEDRRLLAVAAAG